MHHSEKTGPRKKLPNVCPPQLIPSTALTASLQRAMRAWKVSSCCCRDALTWPSSRGRAPSSWTSLCWLSKVRRASRSWPMGCCCMYTPRLASSIISLYAVRASHASLIASETSSDSRAAVSSDCSFFFMVSALASRRWQAIRKDTPSPRYTSPNDSAAPSGEPSFALSFSALIHRSASNRMKVSSSSLFIIRRVRAARSVALRRRTMRMDRLSRESSTLAPCSS
mmetsp:Transcript_11054/g.32072  ORF Transcript_11054/g.32072 Transcript_11054/m.32072 type:complete len:225 (-) Transcript_11054:37-711(-)